MVRIYTFRNCCVERQGLELGDGTTKIFLNTKGIVGEVDEDIQNFLAYVDGHAAEGKFTQDIAQEVEKVKLHKETRLEYMTLLMEMKEQRREGRQEGRQEGIAGVIINMLKEHYPYEVISKLAETTTDDVIRIAKETGLAYN